MIVRFKEGALNESVCMNVYFVTIGIRSEMDIIKKVRPKHILCSYWYFSKKPMADFVSAIGYRPDILLDSGAYSAYAKKKEMNINEYMEYIRNNQDYISRYISLDVIGDSGQTKRNYWTMRECGLNPIPVVHYGEPADDVALYESLGADTIALGNTVGIRDKDIVSKWCAELHKNYPNVNLHLLGSSSKKILEGNVLSSCDSSAWYMMAVNGKPKTIPGKTREAKKARAEANMLNIMEVFNESPVSFDNCDIKCSNGNVQSPCLV